jgi:hypothetical protein
VTALLVLRPLVAGVRRTAAAMVVAAVVLLVASSPATAMTGVEWQRLSPPARTAYVTGVVDAWVGLVQVQESLGNRDPGIKVFTDLVACLSDRLISTKHIAAAVERYIKGQPGLDRQEMPDIVFIAIGPLCR